MKVFVFGASPNDLPIIDKYSGEETTVVSCVEPFTDYFNYKGYKTITGKEFFENRNVVDLTVGAPVYSKRIYIKYLDYATLFSKKIHILIPDTIIMDERTNHPQNYLLKRIDGHIEKMTIIKSKDIYPNVAIRSNLVYLQIDMEKTFDEFEVDHRNLGVKTKVKSIFDVNSFGNYDTYPSFKKKVLSYIEDNKKTLLSVFEESPSGKYKIPFRKFSNYYIISEKVGREKGSEYRKVTTEQVQSGFSFNDESIANSCFQYLKNPIAILAFHILKKGFTVDNRMLNTVPVFDSVSDFLNPEKALNLTKEEIEFAQHIYENRKIYFNF